MWTKPWNSVHVTRDVISEQLLQIPRLIFLPGAFPRVHSFFPSWPFPVCETPRHLLGQWNWNYHCIMWNWTLLLMKMVKPWLSRSSVCLTERKGWLVIVQFNWLHLWKVSYSSPTIFSNGSIIPPGFKFTELHTLTVAARSYALLSSPMSCLVTSSISHHFVQFN